MHTNYNNAVKGDKCRICMWMCKIHAFSRIILKLVVVEGFVVTVELFAALLSSA